MSVVSTPLSKEDLAAIEGTFDTVARLVRAGDWAGWARLFAEDAVFHPPGAPPLRGRAAIQAWAEALPPMDAFALSNRQVTGEGNVAYGTSVVLMTMRGLPPDTAKQLVVWRRGAQGWEVVAVSFNSDLPQPA